MSAREFVIGSRGSDLALWQARWAAAHLGVPTRIEIISTQGDRILDRDLSGAEGKGFFTKELEEALFAKSVDIAVHSLKDLPTLTPPGLTIAAVCERAPVSDVLLVNPDWYDPSDPFPVKKGGKVGASSLRRQAYVRASRTDLEPASLRGNVPTRVRKCREGQYAAVVLAEAGLSRLKLDVGGLRLFRLSTRQWLPAPGQGALGIETRASDPAEGACQSLNHLPTRRACDIERGLLARFEGGCHLPLGTYAEATPAGFRFRAVFAPEPNRLIRCEVSGTDPGQTVEAAFAALNVSAKRGESVHFDRGALCEPIAAWS
jgi:hydroxymethylbilane synthase